MLGLFDLLAVEQQGAVWVETLSEQCSCFLHCPSCLPVDLFSLPLYRSIPLPECSVRMARLYIKPSVLMLCAALDRSVTQSVEIRVQTGRENFVAVYVNQMQTDNANTQR